MHESIAQALYRGEIRQSSTREESKLAWLQTQLKKRPTINRRGPWLRATKYIISHLPTFTVLGAFDLGQKKHIQGIMMGLTHPKTLSGDAWYGGMVRLDAKTCDVLEADLPIKVTHHAVARLMQRGNVTQPKDALHWLAPAFFYATLVEVDPPTHAVLLPCVDGAIVARQDDHNPGSWVFLTFIDAAQLRPEQRAELAMRMDKFHDRGRELGWRITFRNIAGAEIRINPASLAA